MRDHHEEHDEYRNQPNDASPSPDAVVRAFDEFDHPPDTDSDYCGEYTRGQDLRHLGIHLLSVNRMGWRAKSPAVHHA